MKLRWLVPIVFLLSLRLHASDPVGTRVATITINSNEVTLLHLRPECYPLKSAFVLFCQVVESASISRFATRRSAVRSRSVHPFGSDTDLANSH
jgi:hypothetical protein